MATYLCASVLLLFSICFSFTTAADNDDDIAKLVARIDALERQGKEHADIVKGQNAELGGLRTVVVKQQEELAAQKAIIKDLQEWKESHTKKEHAEQPAPDGAITLGNLDSLSHVLGSGRRNSSGKTRRALMNYEGPVAFQAVIPDGEHPKLGLNQKIIFDRVNVNLGAGYHNQAGLFIAPMAGLYIFSTSILSYTHNSDSLTVALMKNGHMLGSAYAHSDTGNYDQGSVSVVTQLAVGDEVWVSHRYGSTQSIWGDYYSSFMGCLVVPT